MASVKDVAVPDIGDFSDIPIIEVLVSPGDEVRAEDPLVTLESDKATMDVPAPFAGVVKELKVQIGDKVSEGSPLLTLEVEVESEGEGEQPAAAPAKETAGESAPPAPTETESPTPAETAAGDGAPTQQTVAYASPSVRRLARELKVDLARVEGTGRKGRIVKSDVESFAKDGGKAAGVGATDGAGLGLAPWPQVDFEKFGAIDRIQLPRIKKIAGPNLARNWVMIPHVTHHDEADVTDLEAFRKELNAEQQDVKVTMVALLIKACVASLKAFPEFNASLDGDELVLKRYWHIGFATDTPQGLVVPVIRDADEKGLLVIAAELRELSGKARDGKLHPNDMSGGTFSISSLGGIGGTGFTPIVNAPEVAILGVTRSAMKPVWDGKQFEPRLMLPLSLSYDHRVIDGAAAARFTAHLAGALTDLRRVLL
jgi:pyruvate dehydrogenase E2 component (dihydrolipoamide acetyltransferase)